MRPLLEDDLRLFRHVQAEAAVILGHGQPEQAEFLHFLDDLGGDGILLLDAVLVRDQPLVEQTAHGLAQQ